MSIELDGCAMVGHLCEGIGGIREWGRCEWGRNKKKDAPVRNIPYGVMRRDYRPRYFSKNSLNLRMTDVLT